jgi:hypothetical protein
MVYLKIKREDIKWQWIYDISEVISIGYVDLGSFDPTEYGARGWQAVRRAWSGR